MNIKTIEENKGYLDSVAKITLQEYLKRAPLTGFKDSMSVSRIAYNQALAMLKVREESLISLAKEQNLIDKEK